MTNLTSGYGPSNSWTNVPEGPAREDMSAYLRALLTREDEWRRTQAQDGANRAAAAQRQLAAPGAVSASNRVGAAGGSSPRMSGGGPNMEPYYTTVPTGFNQMGGAILASGPGPGANFAGYRPKGSGPQNALMDTASLARTSGASGNIQPVDLDAAANERRLAEARAMEARARAMYSSGAGGGGLR